MLEAECSILILTPALPNLTHACREGGGKGNYVIDSPGTYRIKNGKVTRLA